VVESENKESWRYFFKHLAEAIPEIIDELCILISDRDKGIAAAEEELGQYIVRAVCCHYLKDNFTTKFSRTLKPLFWSIVNANSISRFDALILKLRGANNDAADYLLDSNPSLWAKAYFDGTRFGHNTSNVVESINKTLKLDRELPVL
jgi:hypothetical protein